MERVPTREAEPVPRPQFLDLNFAQFFYPLPNRMAINFLMIMSLGQVPEFFR